MEEKKERRVWGGIYRGYKAKGGLWVPRNAVNEQGIPESEEGAIEFTLALPPKLKPNSADRGLNPLGGISIPANVV